MSYFLGRVQALPKTVSKGQTDYECFVGGGGRGLGRVAFTYGVHQNHKCTLESELRHGSIYQDPHKNLFKNQ